MPRPLDKGSKMSSLVEQLLSLPCLLHDKRVPPERLEIMRLDRPTPKIAITEQKSLKSKRKKDVYVTYPWLTACNKTQRMYCWYCLLLPEDPTHARGNDALDAQTLGRHASKISHKDAVNLYGRIVDILNDCSAVQIKILPSKRVEVLSVEQLRETLELDVQIEKKYLEEIHKPEEYNKETILELLKMSSVLKTGTIDKARLDIFKLGKPTPKLNNVNSIFTWIKVRDKYVQVDTKYLETTWLAGCAVQNKYFCWTCVLFGILDCDTMIGKNYWTKEMENEHLRSTNHIKSSELYVKVENIVRSDPYVEEIEVASSHLEISIRTVIRQCATNTELLAENSGMQSTTEADILAEDSKTQSTTEADILAEDSKTQSATEADILAEDSGTQSTTEADILAEDSGTQSTTEAEILAEDSGTHLAMDIDILAEDDLTMFAATDADILAEEEFYEHANAASTSSLIKHLLTLPHVMYKYRIPPERIQYVKLNRPTPTLADIVKYKNVVRFNVTIYSKFPWVAGCTKTQRLYCWPCALLSPEYVVDTSDDEVTCATWAFNDIRGLTSHCNTKVHVAAVRLYFDVVDAVLEDDDVQLKIWKRKVKKLTTKEIEIHAKHDRRMVEIYLNEVHTDENQDGVAKLLSLIRDETITPEVLDIFKSGRPRPMLPYLHYMWIRVEGRYVRIIKEYAQVQWLAGCPRTQNLYCWRCLLFQRTSDLGHWWTYLASDHSKSDSHKITIKLFRQLKYILENNSCNFKEIQINGDKLVVVESEIVDDEVDCVKETQETSLPSDQLCSVVNLEVPSCNDEELEPADIFEKLIVHQPYINTLTREILQIIRAGRPTPILPNLNVPCVPYVLPYDEVPWLTACNVRNEIYCWVCLLFSAVDKSIISKYTTKGINQLSSKIHLHSLSRLHVGAQEVYDKAVAQCGGATAREPPRDEVKDCRQNYDHGRLHVGAQEVYDKAVAQCGRATAQEPPRDEVKDCRQNYGQRTGDLSNNEPGDIPASSDDVVTSADCDDNHPRRPESELVLKREGDPDVDVTLRTPHYTFETVFLPEILESTTETSQHESPSSESTMDCNLTQRPKRAKRKNLSNFEYLISERFDSSNDINVLKRLYLMKGLRRPKPNCQSQVELYNKIPWLTGCVRTQLMFCWPCLLFTQHDTTWTSPGVDNVDHVTSQAGAHEADVDHVAAVTTYNDVENIIRTMSLREVNTEVLKYFRDDYIPACYKSVRTYSRACCSNKIKNETMDFDTMIPESEATPLPQIPLSHTPLPQIPLSHTPLPQIYLSHTPLPKVPPPQTPKREDLPVTPDEGVIDIEDVTSSVDTVLTNKRTPKTYYRDFHVKKLKCDYLTLTDCPLEEGEIINNENFDLFYKRNKLDSDTWELTLLNGDNIKTCLVLS